MTISTGGRYDNIGGPTVDSSGVMINTSNILYDDSIAKLRSAPFEVPEGYYAVLVGYNMEQAAGAEFVIDGVTLGSQHVANGGACCNGVEDRGNKASTTATVLFRETMTLGGNAWKITQKTPRVIVAVPGWYVVELNDGDHIGQGLQLEYRLVKQKLQLPEAYFPGIKGA